MVIICKKWYLKRVYSSITLFPFIFVQEGRVDEVLLNHEKIHIRQQAELLIVFFYIWYLLNYGWNILKYRNIDKAYRNIIFEREAYKEEYNLTYLKKRKFLGFLRY